MGQNGFHDRRSDLLIIMDRNIPESAHLSHDFGHVFSDHFVFVKYKERFLVGCGQLPAIKAENNIGHVYARLDTTLDI
jgi:hypothetical protein